MLPYVIAGIVAVILLYGAYRMLGGSAASRPVDSGALLRAALDAAVTAAAELRMTAEGDIAPAVGRHGGDASRTLRRRLDGAAQLLQQVDAGELAEPQAASHAVLSAAVDELNWSLRLMQSPGFASAAGMHAAADALQEHAARCIDEAQALLSASAAEVPGGTT